MAEVEKADIEKLHTRLDKITENCLTPIKVGMGRLEQRLDDLKIPTQPCNTLTEHIESHKQTKTLWNNAIVRTALDLIKMGVVLIAGYLFGKIN